MRRRRFRCSYGHDFALPTGRAVLACYHSVHAQHSAVRAPISVGADAGYDRILIHPASPKPCGDHTGTRLNDIFLNGRRTTAKCLSP
jgi:hypothetical protein